MKAKHAKKMPLKKRIMLLILCLSLSVCVAIGGSYSYAWLITGATNNGASFSNSTIVIPTVTQATTTANFPMVPGGTIGIDPLITVPKGMNINAYLFIKVAKTGSLDSYVTYSYADGWVQYSTSTTADVYYRNVDGTSSAAKTYYVFNASQMYVKSDITRSDTFTAAAPTVTVTAALVQRDARTAAQAYGLISGVL